MLKSICALAGALALATLASVASAQTTVTSTRASYISVAANTVQSRTTNANTFTGQDSSQEYASYVEFAVPASSTAFTSVELQLDAGNVVVGPNIVTVRDFNSSISSATIAAMFADATTGSSFGSTTATTNGQALSISLNAAGIAAVNAARGSTIAFGFAAGPRTAPTDGVFAGSDGATTRQMVLTPTATPVVTPVAQIPTMTEWAMILFGTILAGGAALYIQRRKLAA